MAPAPDRRRWLNTLLLLAAAGAVVAVLIWAFGGPSGDPGDASPQSDAASSEEPADNSSNDVPSFGPFELDLQRLETEWSAERESLGEFWRPGPDGGHPVIGPAEQELMEQFFRINAQSLDPNINESQLAALSEHLTVSASAYIRRDGPRAWKALGWQLADEFLGALDDLAEAAEATGLPPVEVVQSPDDRGRQLRERLGNFLTMAQRTGLVDESGELRHDRALATVLFRFRWFGFAQDYASTSLLTPYERIVLWRWQIEEAEGLPVVQRVALVDNLEAVYAGTIHPDAVRGILYFEAGELARAASYFRRASRSVPDDPRYRSWESTAQRLAASE